MGHVALWKLLEALKQKTKYLYYDRHTSYVHIILPTPEKHHRPVLQSKCIDGPPETVLHPMSLFLKLHSPACLVEDVTQHLAQLNFEGEPPTGLAQQNSPI